MKRTVILISLFISILVISSCREIYISTVVNNDGSFTRIVTITGDSTEVVKSGLPYPVDHTWKMDLKRDTTGDGGKDYILTYTKSYRNSTLINAELSEDTSWRRKLDRSILIEKRFGFFYSYLVYKETIGAADPFKLIDYTDYLSKEDMLWLTGKKLAINSIDSANIKKADDKSDEYLEATLTAEIVAILKEGIVLLDNPNIAPDQVDYFKDSITSRIDGWDLESSSDFVDFYAKWINNIEIYKIKEIESRQFKNLDNKIQFLIKIIEMENYKVTVELPGIITETNSLSIKGNQVLWKVNSSSILFEDLNMVVESRVVNKWMFVITGIILLLLIALIIYKSTR